MKVILILEKARGVRVTCDSLYSCGGLIREACHSPAKAGLTTKIGKTSARTKNRSKYNGVLLRRHVFCTAQISF